MLASAASLTIEKKAEARNASSVWLQVASRLDPKFGGISACVPPLAEATELFGRHIAPVAAFCGPDEDMSLIEGRNLQVFQFPQGRALWMRNKILHGKLRELIEAADGVHIHGIWEEHCAIAANLAREAGKPYIIAAHGMLEGWALEQKKLKKTLYSLLVERPNLRGAACLQALTRAEAEDYRRFGLKNPIAVIPNGVDAPSNVTPDLFRWAFPELQGKRLVMFLSRLHRKKGLDILCQAWSRVRRKYPDTHLVLAGPDFDDTRASIEELVDMLDIRDSVTFTGMLGSELKWSALAASEVFVLPSYSEGFSMAILEALSMGVPVVITRPCNFPEVAERGCGAVIEPDARRLEAALISMLNASPDELKTIGNNGRQLVAERYTWNAVGRQVTETYDWVLGGKLPATVQVMRTAAHAAGGAR